VFDDLNVKNRAFIQWFRQCFPDVGEGAYYLALMSTRGQDSIVWDYLERLGEVAYGHDAYLRISRSMLGLEVGAAK
jgi:hypothetical protein